MIVCVCVGGWVERKNEEKKKRKAEEIRVIFSMVYLSSLIKKVIKCISLKINPNT